MKITIQCVPTTDLHSYINQNPNTQLSKYDTPAGQLSVLKNNSGIIQATFEKNDDSNSRLIIEKKTELILIGTPFQTKVWQALLEIPTGKTISYQELACQVGHPNSWRAVANAVGQNNIAYFIPCHRVIRKNGQLGGYRWGIEKKKQLLHAEKFV